jgi:MoxR-like ATPase
MEQTSSQPSSQRIHAAEFSSPELIEQAADRFRADHRRVREEIGRAVVGQSTIVEGVLTSLFCAGHVLLEGVPGIGKTLLVRTLGQALSLNFSRVQFTPDLMPADITGTSVVMESAADGARDASGQVLRERRLVFQRGPIFAQIVLADEINRATPKTQSALLEAMQERSVTAGGTTYALPEPFLVLATQNPIEQEGTYPLPEAQLDRFFFKLMVGAPSRAELGEILERTTTGASASVRGVLDQPALLAHQRLVRIMGMAPHVRDYAVRLVLATHPSATAPAGERLATPMVEKYVRLGASPRAAQTLALAAKCRALVEGRVSASIDDVRWAALPALRHRMIMNFESHAEGVGPDAVISNLLATLPVEASA